MTFEQFKSITIRELYRAAESDPKLISILEGLAEKALEGKRQIFFGKLQREARLLFGENEWPDTIRKFLDEELSVKE